MFGKTRKMLFASYRGQSGSGSFVCSEQFSLTEYRSTNENLWMLHFSKFTRNIWVADYNTVNSTSTRTSHREPYSWTAGMSTTVQREVMQAASATHKRAHFDAEDTSRRNCKQRPLRRRPTLGLWTSLMQIRNGGKWRPKISGIWRLQCWAKRQKSPRTEKDCGEQGSCRNEARGPGSRLLAAAGHLVDSDPKSRGSSSRAFQ